ncbi:MAG: SLC13 family permease [Gammaproteobacteria bacterium]|nr:SLC13 family permease [Gammaproteobacteria bacterium]
MQEIALTTEMTVILGVLALTVFLFVSEVVRVDVTAVTIMVLLGLLTMIPGLEGIIDTRHLLDGFGSNAVISIVALMIIGAGLDRTGLMGRLAGLILRFGGATEKRIIPLISSTVGVISSFMQNVGAAALFLPVVSRISTRTGLPMSRLLMPMGFCAICGGTMTMVGSSPLILLNDLILNANRTLPGDRQMATFGLFSVTPIGIAIVLTGIGYFVLLGRMVLPEAKGADGDQLPAKTSEYFEQVYGINGDLFEARVTIDSPLVGLTIEEIESRFEIPFILAQRNGDDLIVPPPRDEIVWVNSTLGLLGPPEQMASLAADHSLVLNAKLQQLADVLNPSQAGIAELVIPPSSNLVGRTIREVRMRKTYGLNVLRILRGGDPIESESLRDETLTAGDTLVAHTRWRDLHLLSGNRDFVIITDHPHEELRPHKVRYAVFFLTAALGLVLFTDLRLSIALLTGAVGMILSGVLSIDEAYGSVDWKTVFLLASLIPLGLAVETTGTAAWIAQQTLELLGDVPIWVLQTVLGALATFFTLVMSNVGATVLLVPLAVNIAVGAGADPAVFALTVAICTSNSFLIPTHQVNALIMGPAGYRVRDFVVAGSIMTVLFLIVALLMLNLIF